MGPLSYVYGYRGGIGRRGVAQDTNGDDGIKTRARVLGGMQSGWGQFGAVKKLFSFIAGLRRQL